MKTPYLFVYGTLRRGFKNDAYAYISGYFDYAGDAKTKGYLYNNGAFPVAVPTEENHLLHGELYTIRHDYEYDYAMMQLDDYEGVNTEEGESPKYVRRISKVYTPNGEVDAWVYWYNGAIEGLDLIHSGDMLEYIQSGK